MSNPADTMPFAKMMGVSVSDASPERVVATLIVRSETIPVHRGKRTSVWQTKISTEDGKPVALVIQTQMVLFSA